MAPPSDALTIGAYGWTEPAFFAAIERASVATFCDVRRRRGVRGHEYAFANAGRLQRRLDELGIGYVHRLDLAPSDELRATLAEADKAARVRRRDRTQLTPEFVRAYEAECLRNFDAKTFLAEHTAAGPVVLFCVERVPTACHRGLVAARLGEVGADVRHLTP